MNVCHVIVIKWCNTCLDKTRLPQIIRIMKNKKKKGLIFHFFKNFLRVQKSELRFLNSLAVSVMAVIFGTVFVSSCHNIQICMYSFFKSFVVVDCILLLLVASINTYHHSTQWCTYHTLPFVF